MPALTQTTIHETHTTRHAPDGTAAAVDSMSKTIYTIDVTDMRAVELFHGLGNPDRDGAPVASLTVTLTDHAAPFVTACGHEYHQRTYYYGELPTWATAAIRDTVPHVLTTQAA